MKRICYILLLFISTVYNIESQKHDYNWVMGRVKDNNNNPANFKNLITFNDHGIDQIKSISSIDSKVSAYNLTASDSVGNLAFFFNGYRVFSRNNKMMMNGDSIGFTIYPKYRDTLLKIYGCYLGDDCESLDYTQKFIPFPGNPNQYLVFYQYQDENKESPPFVLNRLFYLRIDMNQDSGFGAVVEKDKLLIDSYIAGINLVKHANGKDWWLVTSRISSNIFYVYLITKEGITGPKKIIEGPEIGTVPLLGYGSVYPRSTNHSLFSPDGSILATIQEGSWVLLYGFDRCSGALQYIRTLSNIPYLVQIAFSPNSKYIYFSGYGNIYQLDIIDTAKIPYIIGVLPSFAYLQLGPDGKIYFSSYTTKHIGYINRPNLPYLSCDLKIFPFSTPNSNPYQIPQYPNYRLGRIENSQCNSEDTFFLPTEPNLFHYNGKEYINADRYKLILDKSWKDLYHSIKP